MNIKEKFKSFFYLEEEEQEAVEKPPVHRPQREEPPVREQMRKNAAERRAKAADSPNLISLQTVTKSAKVTLVEPRAYAEAQDIAEHLKSKRSVVVNLQRVERDQGIRIIDFLSGTVYALGGDIQRIGRDIFICVPDTVEVDGVISDLYYEDQHKN
ncbi:cell division protein SepF [Indiicoccus explosivorum]|uniref:cell division protein SepF n=1 Tax=Indiicoccus explosivorum TaxID=1917864 RepID=UPI000B445DC7|nr:cell division protein SepF [Indiicoccus explosivorum]